MGHGMADVTSGVEGRGGPSGGGAAALDRGSRTTNTASCLLLL